VGALPDLDELAATIEARTPAGSSLDRLGAAAAVAGELRELGDLLLDRYVQAARAENRPWSQIGEALGVTKQAAQQRFPAAPADTQPWPGLSAAASGVLGRAAAHARSFGHRYLGTEHVLLALASDDGLAGAALARSGVEPAAVEAEIGRIIGHGHSSGSATLGVTPRTKRALEAARKEARRLGHRCADCEHVLLAITESEGVAQQIVADFGAGPTRVREQLADLLAGEAPELAEKLRAGPTRRRLLRARG
jgi:hypothetical protein